MNPVRIMIADDHQMIREGLKQLLEMDGKFLVVEQANDGEECLEKLKNTKPDVLLLDINMPKLNGIQVLKKIREENDKQKVLVLTIHNEIEYLEKAVEIGVNGYILKDADYQTLEKAIFHVSKGEDYIEPSLTPRLKERMVRPPMQYNKNEILTRREIEILQLLAEGLFNKEIAYKLSISEKTVKNHVSNIFKKIKVSDRTQAAVYAIRNNYVELK